MLNCDFNGDEDFESAVVIPVQQCSFASTLVGCNHFALFILVEILPFLFHWKVPGTQNNLRLNFGVQW